MFKLFKKKLLTYIKKCFVKLYVKLVLRGDNWQKRFFGNVSGFFFILKKVFTPFC